MLFPVSAIMGTISCKGNRNAPPPYPPYLEKPKKHIKKKQMKPYIEPDPDDDQI